MKKSLLLIVIILSCLRVNAQEENDTLVSIGKFDYREITSLYELGMYYSGPPDFLEIVPDGLAMENPQRQDKMWDYMFPIIGRLVLEEGHDYVVRLTLKVPSDGTYWVDLCSWNQGYSFARQLSVVASHDFQIIDVDYPEYGCRATDGMVIFGRGWVVGTTILKEVEVFEKTTTARMKSAKPAKSSGDSLYNLSGQKVNASYKGIVIQNGKKVVK